MKSHSDIQCLNYLDCEICQEKAWPSGSWPYQSVIVLGFTPDHRATKGVFIGPFKSRKKSKDNAKL